MSSFQGFRSGRERAAAHQHQAAGGAVEMRDDADVAAHGSEGADGLGQRLAEDLGRVGDEEKIGWGVLGSEVAKDAAGAAEVEWIALDFDGFAAGYGKRRRRGLVDHHAEGNDLLG